MSVVFVTNVSFFFFECCEPMVAPHVLRSAKGLEQGGGKKPPKDMWQNHLLRKSSWMSSYLHSWFVITFFFVCGGGLFVFIFIFAFVFV